MDFCSAESAAPLLFLLPTVDDIMLPKPVLALANVIFTLLASLAMARSIAYGIWMPPAACELQQMRRNGTRKCRECKQSKHTDPDDWSSRGLNSSRTVQLQKMRGPLRAALWIHLVLYLVELGCTNMLCDYTSMAVHHGLSLVLFALTLYDSSFVCCVWVVPYWIHSVYWVVLTTMHLASIEFLILNVYNISMFLAGGVYYYHAKLQRSSNFVGPFLLFAIVGINYYIYCSPMYSGSMCLYRFDPYLLYLDGDAQILEMAAGAVAVILPVTISTCYLLDRCSCTSTASPSTQPSSTK